MLESLAPDVKNIATLVVLLLPGFLFISTFQAVNIAFARHRSAWEWTMRSLVVSLPIFAMFSAAYDRLGWPGEPTDPEFYLGLFGGAFVAGYAAGIGTGTQTARDLQRKLGFSDPRTIWADVIGQPGSYVIVHLKDGSVIFGYPSSFTNDPREDTREVFLREAARLRRHDDADSGVWEAFSDTDGVLVESSEISFIQLVARPGARARGLSADG